MTLPHEHGEDEREAGANDGEPRPDASPTATVLAANLAAPRASLVTTTSPLPRRHLRLVPEGGERALPPLLAGAVRAALASIGGELEIGAKPHSGTIYFTRGAIAWVVAPAGAEKLPSILRRRASLSNEALRQVIAECRASNRSFVDVLVASQLVDRETLRSIVLEHHARQLTALLRDGAPDRVEFRPSTRLYAGDLTFSLDEVLAEMARIDLPEPSSLSGANAPVTPQQRNVIMANISASLNEVMTIEGAIATALVDWESGLTLGTAGGGPRFDVELAASGNTSVVKAKMAVMRSLGIQGAIEDVLITLDTQYHLLRPLTKTPSLFLYVSIDRAKGNLGLARHKLKAIEASLEV